MPELLLCTLNARHAHASLGLRCLRANLGGPLALNASALSGWKSGDYGITRARTVSLDFPQLRTYYDKGDHGHVARLFVHEITITINIIIINTHPPIFRNTTAITLCPS